MSNFYSDQKGTTSTTYQIGIRKLILDSSNLTQARTLTFPDSNGTTGQVFATDGAGNLSYATRVSSVQASGGTTGLSFAGGPITTTGTLTLAGTLISANGGTGFSTYATGDIIYASAANTLSKLPLGTNGQVLTITAGVPAWGAAGSGAGDVVGPASSVDGVVALYNGTTGKLLKQAGNATIDGNLTITGTSRRITGDFTNATLASSVNFQTSTVNETTRVGVIPNGIGTTATIIGYNNSNPTNSAYTMIQTSNVSSYLASGVVGTGTPLPLNLRVNEINRQTIETTGAITFTVPSLTYQQNATGERTFFNMKSVSPAPADGQLSQIAFSDDSNTGGGGAEKRLAGIVAFRESAADTTTGGRLEFWNRANNGASWARSVGIGNDSKLTAYGNLETNGITTIHGMRETMVALGAGTAINLVAGTYFTKTLSANTTLSITPGSVGAAGTVSSFVLELTLTGAFAVTWWSGIRWPAGTPPTLTPSGRDVLTFYTVDGGTTWNGFMSGKGMA